MTAAPDKTAAKARAEALFKREVPNVSQQLQEASRDAEAEKMAKLRALRLAKEESDRIATEVRRARREQRRS
ncbi:hypothetical protein [Lichenifustis flavocetrariae]|uniref:Uncharacterized protein n=1 Tax=Lichenifustis flavocetrariae TaxID=2949735 RepID=A0AA41Z205_9HYPH|nr:hypothetical protein [Lichenifustis flavocetrariae]MCW6511531.1 hypothetical protein [Lichenifustis flavocetrariae]